MPSQPGGSLSGWQKTDGITAKHVQYGGRMQYYRSAWQLEGIGTVLRVMRPLDFQEACCVLADGGGVDLFGERQVFLYQRDGPPPVMWGPRGGMMGPAGGLKGPLIRCQLSNN